MFINQTTIFVHIVKKILNKHYTTASPFSTHKTSPNTEIYLLVQMLPTTLSVRPGLNINAQCFYQPSHKLIDSLYAYYLESTSSTCFEEWVRYARKHFSYEWSLLLKGSLFTEGHFCAKGHLCTKINNWQQEK